MNRRRAMEMPIIRIYTGLFFILFVVLTRAIHVCMALFHPHVIHLI